MMLVFTFLIILVVVTTNTLLIVIVIVSITLALLRLGDWQLSHCESPGGLPEVVASEQSFHLKNGNTYTKSKSNWLSLDNINN